MCLLLVHMCSKTAQDFRSSTADAAAAEPGLAHAKNAVAVAASCEFTMKESLRFIQCMTKKHHCTAPEKLVTSAVSMA